MLDRRTLTWAALWLAIGFTAAVLVQYAATGDCGCSQRRRMLAELFGLAVD